MEIEESLIKKRDSYWDNLKAVLISLVVIGHLLTGFKLNSDVTKFVIYFIYSFHMPAFVLISGVLGKHYCKNGTVKAQKLGVFLGYYGTFQVLLFLINKFCLQSSAEFSLFTPKIGLWYLMALFFYYLIMPMCEKLPAYITIPALVLLGIFIGMEAKGGTFLSASRIFVFAPFFYVGYYMDTDIVRNVSKISRRLIIGIASLCVGVALIFVMWSKPLGKIMYGKSNYHATKLSFGVGLCYRVGVYIIACFMIVALLMLVPRCKTFFSYIGKNSLQIYLLHLIVANFLFYFRKHFDNFFVIDSALACAVIMVLGLIITLILSIDIFKYPFVWIQTLVLKIFSLKDKKKIKA